MNGHRKAYSVLRSIYGPPSGPIAESVLGHVARATEALSAISGEPYWRTWNPLQRAARHAIHNAPPNIAGPTPDADMRARTAPPRPMSLEFCPRWNCNDIACHKQHLVPCELCAQGCDRAQWGDECCNCAAEKGAVKEFCEPCNDRRTK